jgi:hypothetical protein
MVILIYRKQYSGWGESAKPLMIRLATVSKKDSDVPIPKLMNLPHILELVPRVVEVSNVGHCGVSLLRH